MNTTTTTTDDDLFDATFDALAGTGFLPADADLEYFEELGITERDLKVIGYYVDKGWDAVRIEATDAEAWALLVQWGENTGYRLLAIDRNGVEINEASFRYNATGLAWLRGALEAGDR